MDGWLDVVGFQVDAGQEDTRWRAQGNTVTTLPPPGRVISRILITIRSALGLHNRKNLGLYKIKIKNHTHWQLQQVLHDHRTPQLVLEGAVPVTAIGR